MLGMYRYIPVALVLCTYQRPQWSLGTDFLKFRSSMADIYFVTQALIQLLANTFLHDMDDDDHYCLGKYLLLLLKHKIAYFLLQGQHQLCLAPIAGTSERLFGPGS